MSPVLGNCIVIAVLGVIATLVIRLLYRRHKTGSGCCGNCSCCGKCKSGSL